MAARSIEEIQAAHTATWMAIPGVVGTAIGEEEGVACIKVFVGGEIEKIKTEIPSAVEGVPVVLVQTGEFRALE